MKKRKSKGKKPSVILVVVAVALVLVTILFYETNKTFIEPNYPEHTEYFYVEDYSGVLNEKTESYIMDEAVRLEKATKAQIVVVMVPGTQEQTLYDFSVELANRWGIGDEELDNGVLLLFVTDPDDPHVRMEVGKGLEGALPDGKAGRILDDYAVGPRDKGLWNKAAADTFVATAMEVYGEYGITPPDTLTYGEWEDPDAPVAGTFADAVFPEPVIRENEGSFAEQILMAFFMAVLTLVFLGVILAVVLLFSFFGGGSGGGGSSRGGHYYGGSSGGFHGGGGSFGGGGASR